MSERSALRRFCEGEWMVAVASYAGRLCRTGMAEGGA